MRVITNNVPRFIVEAWELTERERAEFDYVDFDAIKRGEDSASFIRYKGRTYDLSEFTGTAGLPDIWDGYASDSFFSGIVIRFTKDCEMVIVGTYY